MTTAKLKDTYSVVIAGGGPVGLFLGCCLQQQGIPFLILEKQQERNTGSRSLGIHPVSLELFESLGLVGPFLEQGIKIRRGLAYTDSNKIGSISFDSCPGPFNYILALPQYKTEQILENHLTAQNPETLIRGGELIDFAQQDDCVEIKFNQDGTQQTLQAKFLVGCDGKNSTVREKAGIRFSGNSYPDTYIMGDFSDNTSFDNDAAVFLPKDGLIESFPLGNNKRRWVVKTDSYIEEANRETIEKLVAQRISHDLSEQEVFMLSSFGVQKMMADPMVRGRVALAGDAAHIVSPIGGQGMNLGWLDAWELAGILDSSIKSKRSLWGQAFSDYAQRRALIANNAMLRAEVNMRLGRATTVPALRNSLVWLMLHTPLQRLVARLFTMRYLEHRFF